MEGRRQRGGILLFAALVAIPGPLLLAATPPALAIAALLMWTGVGNSGISLGLWDQAMRVIPPDRRLAFVGVLFSVDYALVLVVPILAAAMADAAGIPAALASIGVAAALGAVAVRAVR